jgi:hypothetical protein
MSTARQYRAKAAEYTELLKTASSPSEAREFRDLEQSFITLAENDEWLIDNLEKTNSSSAEDNSYGDILSARQKKTPLGCLEAVDPKQSTEIATKIQQLFDDAGSKGGLSQTATLRGQVSRFLQKHKGDSFS